MRKMNHFRIYVSKKMNENEMDELHGLPEPLQTAFLRNFFYTDEFPGNETSHLFLKMLQQKLSTDCTWFSSCMHEYLAIYVPIDDLFIVFEGSYQEEKKL